MCRRNGTSKVCTGRHKPNVYTRQEQHKTHKGVAKAHPETRNVFPRQVQRNELEQQEQSDDREYCLGDLSDAVNKAMTKACQHIRKAVKRYRCGFARRNLAYSGYNAKNEHSEYRAYGAERNKTKAVVLCILAPSNGGKADAKGHYKRNGDRPCGHAARVKSDRDNGGIRHRHRAGNGEYQNIHRKQDLRKLYLFQYPYERDNERNADARRYGQDNRPPVYSVELIGQYLQIRFGYGDYRAYQEYYGN